MRGRWKKPVAVLCVAALAGMTLAGCGADSKQTDTKDTKTDSAAFATSLDTDKAVTLDLAGFMANFEALDQVVNDFNEYYPNVTVNYEQNDQNSLVSYVKNNSNVDIFMTSNKNVTDKNDAGTYIYDQCLDLSGQDLDVSDIDPDLIKGCTIDGKLVRIPLAKTMCGMAVNTTLLEKEGLELPKNYEEFISVCQSLKDKGYTPIQSAQYHACSDMVLPMAMTILGTDEELVKKVNEGDTSYADSLLPVYERLQTIIENEYTSLEINETYPDDNYDGAILKFFEGDVPFWITTTECFSGMKKRESKSDSYTENPFDYEFCNVPLGDEGGYDYEEPWYGFSVNKDSDDIDYAVEFMRFLSTEDELNKLAEVKGMPSVTVNNSDERFKNAVHAENSMGRYVLNRSMNSDITATIADTANQFGRGEYDSAAAAIEAMKK